MKTSKFFFFFLFSFSFLFNFGFTDKLTDTEKFQLAGLKIGMDGNEAINALTKKYNIQEKELKILWDVDKLVDNNYVENNDFIERIYLYGNEYVFVTFISDVTQNPQKNVVHEVNYSTSYFNPDNIEDSLISLYGLPRIISENISVWCSLEKYDTCKENDAILVAEKGRDSISINLSDRKYLNAIKELEKNERNNRSANF